MLAKKTEIPVISLSDLGIGPLDQFKTKGGMEVIEIQTPDKKVIECFKVEEEDVDAGVDKLLAKLKADSIDLTIFKS